MLGHRQKEENQAIVPGRNSPWEVKQLGRFFSSDGVDVEGVLAKLLVFLECSDCDTTETKSKA